MYKNNLILNDHSLMLNKLVGLVLFSALADYFLLLPSTTNENFSHLSYQSFAEFVPLIDAVINLLTFLTQILLDEFKVNQESAIKAKLRPIEVIHFNKFVNEYLKLEITSLQMLFDLLSKNRLYIEELTNFYEYEKFSTINLLCSSLSSPFTNISKNSTRLILENSIKTMVLARSKLKSKNKLILTTKVKNVLLAIEKLQYNAVSE